MRIACVEDDVDQADVLMLWLEAAGHELVVFGTAASFLAGVRASVFDLLLVDWVLPDSDGGEVITQVREQLGWDTPVIVTTVRDAEADVVAGLRAGADDYLAKPLKQLELQVRIETVARRAKARRQAVILAGVYEIDTERRLMRVAGQPVELTQKELDLAYYLFTNPGKLFSRHHLLDKIWGINVVIDTRTVDTHVSRLRRKLSLNGKHGWQLQPVYGYGYRLENLAEKPAANTTGS